MAQHKAIIQGWLKRVTDRHWIMAGYALAGLILSVAVLSWLWPAPPKAVKQVRMTQLVDQFVHKTAQQDLSDNQRQQAVRRFTQRLNRRVQQLAARNHWVIVPAEAVMAGAPDVTEEVKAGLARQPTNHGKPGS